MSFVNCACICLKPFLFCSALLTFQGVQWAEVETASYVFCLPSDNTVFLLYELC
jgi:hypothetical protein